MTRPVLVLLCFCSLAAPAGAASPPDDARQLLDRWLAAQNKRDFGGYQALYADGFAGIKRVGTRVVKLDRAGWMKDRERMFAKAITVEATGISVAMSDKGATVRFVQSFATPSFSDRGPKILVLERGPGGLRISREEMLSSEVAPQQRAAGDQPLPLEKFAFVDEGELVLESDVDADRALGLIKALRLVARQHGQSDLRGGVRAARVPAADKVLAGRRIRVFGNTGQVCEATVGTHYSIRARREDYGTEEPAPTPLEMIKNDDGAIAWIHLVVELTPVSGRCGKGRWARAAELPAAVRFAQKERGAAEDAALAAFRALPDWSTAQKEYEKAKPEMLKHEEIAAPAPKRWDDLPGALTIESIRGAASTLSYVQAFGGEGCGGSFFQFQSALIEVPADKPALLRYSGEGFEYMHPVALVDLDGDGIEELIIDNGEYGHTYVDYGLYHLRDGRYRRGQAITHPRMTCHC
jgi:hypothetical protein